jgi:hypothetical protein
MNMNRKKKMTVYLDPELCGWAQCQGIIFSRFFDEALRNEKMRREGSL